MTDAEAVTRFEAHAHNQRPAPKWEPVTPYDLDSRRIAEGRNPFLIKEVFAPTEVIDMGCGFGYLVRFLRELGIECTGYDKHYGYSIPGIYPADIADPDEFLTTNDGDLVVCREVLEHLPVLDVVQAVRNIVRLSRKYIYVTTRFAKQPDHFLSVETEFDADPTHITCLTKPFLRTLFILEGCKSRPDLEAKMDWQKKGRCLVFEVA